MTTMQHLGLLDGAFLHLESAEMPMHVASLHRYQLPDGYAGNWFEDVKAHLATRLHLAPVFTRKLAPMPFDLANPVWIEDDDIDLDYHVRHAILPKPGTQEQFEALAARLHSTLMDRSRPLWEFYVIEGLSDGTVGFYSKVHHAAIDGKAGVVLGNSMLDLTPEPRVVRPPRRRPSGRYQLGMAEMLSAAVGNSWRKTRLFGALLPALLRTAASGAAKSVLSLPSRLGPRDDEAASMWRMAPPTPFNVSVTNQRAFATLSLPLGDVKQTGKALGASVNDMVLWLCASALRGYLADSHALPKRPLVAAVPVSLRAEGDTSMNTQATMSRVGLATQVADPLQRLRSIMAATASMKSQVGLFKDIIPTDFPSLGAPWLLSGLASLYGRSGLADRLRVSNVTISNVPGVPVPLYLAGAMMLDYYPLSIVIHGVALNITVQSYRGQLCFGFIACRRAVPDVREIARHMQDAFGQLSRLPQPAVALEAAATVAQKTKAASKRQASVKSAAKPAAKPQTKRKAAAKPGQQARATSQSTPSRKPHSAKSAA